MTTGRREYILEHLGAPNWGEVMRVFGGKSLRSIEHEIAEMFPEEDPKQNEYLAELIDCELEDYHA